MMQDFLKTVAAVDTKDKLACFIRQLRNDLLQRPTEWENDALDSYLEALASWTESIDNFYKNNNIAEDSLSSWQKFAAMLLAAKYYE